MTKKKELPKSEQLQETNLSHVDVESVKAGSVRMQQSASQVIQYASCSVENKQNVQRRSRFAENHFIG